MTVAIIGTGNVGSHLTRRLLGQGTSINAVVSRSPALDKERFAGVQILQDPAGISLDTDLVVIAVRDNGIVDMSQNLSHLSSSTTIVHTAGSISSDVLSIHENRGVLYPLQTFTKGSPVDWTQIPVLVTASNETAEQTILEVAGMLSGVTKVISDDERLVLHLCATIANNFGNHMFDLSHRIAVRHNLDFDLLRPLIHETSRKVMTMDPARAQTGAAVRNDTETMHKHLDILEGEDLLQELYKQISRSIKTSDQK